MTIQRTILGIETSCDETSAAVVKNGNDVLSNVIASSLELHKKTGGIVPEVAAREQIKFIIPVVEKALKDSKLTFEKIDAIAVAYGPGLIGSLLTGVETARALAFAWNKPIIPINHIAGNIYSNFLERKEKFRFPIVVLTVSGGHNELVLMKKNGSFQVLGETIDDAAGEAFDKVARLLGLPYPGGPAISKVAACGDANSFCLPHSWLERPVKKRFCGTNFDFSFSGLKSEMRRIREKIGKKFTKKLQADLAASFEETVTEVLSQKTIAAADRFKAKEIHLAGGVSANRRLRSKIRELAGSSIQIRFPVKGVYCTDNAAMIASAGFFRQKKSCSWKKLRVDAQDFGL